MIGAAKPRKLALHGGSALAIVTTLAATIPALSQEFVWNSGHGTPIDRTDRLLPADSADRVFAERWSGEVDDYILGSDGAVRANSGTDNGQSHSILHTHNGNAQNGINSGSAHPIDQSTECGPSPLSRDKVRQLVEEAADRHGVDPVFALGVAWAESDFDRNRNSPKGARGVMQLMPATADRFGVIDVCDPAENIEGGVTYLRILFEQFENPLIVAAAYNAGEGRVLEYGGIPPFHETVGFVAKVLNYQLGLSMPSAARPAPGASTLANANGPDTGVITARAHGEFVGGVMHFNWREE